MEIDEVVRLLRRLADGLAELHKQEEHAALRERSSIGAVDSPEHGKANPQEWKWGGAFGLLTPQRIHYNRKEGRFRVTPIGVTNFLWNVFPCAMYEEWVDSTTWMYAAPEQGERTFGHHLTPQTDQYMLGRLAIEMLEGCLLKEKCKSKSELVQFWNKPEEFVVNRWRTDHIQLWTVLEKLLRKDPSNRYVDMHEVAKKFAVLEDQGRALAKSVYSRLENKFPGALNLQSNSKFFEEFYEAFFATSGKAKATFLELNRTKKEQANKLREAMVAVLKFREGNDPTSLENYVKVHRDHKFEEEDYTKFLAAFLKTLDKYSGNDEQLHKAWPNLFKPVMEFMISRCAVKHSADKGQASGKPAQEPSVER
jgi:hemoglobin-like flavoprotein